MRYMKIMQTDVWPRKLHATRINNVTWKRPYAFNLKIGQNGSTVLPSKIDPLRSMGHHCMVEPAVVQG